MFDDLLFVVNIAGVRAHAEELTRASRSFAVVGFQETGLRDEQNARRLFARLYPDHHLASLFLQDEDGVGCALLVHRFARLRRLQERTSARHRLQLAEVEVRGRLVSVASLYVPPVGSGGALDSSFLRDSLARRCSVVAGDLNARSVALGCRSTNAHGDTLASFLLGEGGLETVVLSDPGEPTFVHRSVPFADTIDWALSSPAASRFLSARLGPDLGSDHLPLAISFRSPAPTPLRSSAALRWRTTRVNSWEPFRQAAERELDAAGLLDAGPPTSPQELDSSVATLEAALQAAADATLTRSRPIADSGQLPFPWWVVQLVRTRNRLRRQLAARPSDALRQRLRDTRSLLQRELEAHRRKCLEAKARFFAAGPKRQSRLFWQAIRHWFRPPRRDLPPLANPSGPSAVTPPERAEVFATHLEAVFGGSSDPTFDEAFRAATESAVSQDTDLQPLASTDGLPALDSDDPCRPVSPAEVSLAVDRLRAGKAPGLDGLAPDLLRHAPAALSYVLADLFFASLRLGYLPRAWRHCALRLLPKQGKPLTEPGHYRFYTSF